MVADESDYDKNSTQLTDEMEYARLTARLDNYGKTIRHLKRDRNLVILLLCACSCPRFTPVFHSSSKWTELSLDKLRPSA